MPHTQSEQHQPVTFSSSIQIIRLFMQPANYWISAEQNSFSVRREAKLRRLQRCRTLEVTYALAETNLLRNRGEG